MRRDWMGLSRPAGALVCAAAISLLLLLLGCSGAAPREIAQSSRPIAEVAQNSRPPAATPPFAKVSLAMKGCTSCVACRTSIRRMIKRRAGTQSIRLSADVAEVRYASAQTIPLKEVVQSLAQNRLHDLKLVDVLFEANGTIEQQADGGLAFVLPGTGQKFPLIMRAGRKSPPPTQPVHLVAVLKGWREDSGRISLRAMTLWTGDR